MAHPEIFLPTAEVDDPIQRFVAVTKFYLCGWHIKPPCVYLEVADRIEADKLAEA
jgi:hypothetical protein